ncbi:hypothetical protein GCM10009654_15370 [Streptomyces hebeiensis]|uniref:ESAT-6 protein secretion system EspG family protein n=1 Tax=Streptomyces hebeiensis TaxID=229486 RepID=A0ABN1UN89_9ACTN
MHDHDTSERLVTYADVLAGELPGAWTSTHHPAEDKDHLAELTDRIWDLDLIAQTLAEHPLQQAAVLTRDDGAQLAVLDRHDDRDGFLIAAVSPGSLPNEAYQGVSEPNGIALTDDPFAGAELVAGDLLARYDAALAQARLNATEDVLPSRTDRLVLTWQPDGSLTATPADENVAAILLDNGFVHDETTGLYRLSGDDTLLQARAVQAIGPLLDAHGISAALQHPSGRTAPSSSPPPVPPLPRSAAARTR